MLKGLFFYTGNHERREIEMMWKENPGQPQSKMQMFLHTTMTTLTVGDLRMDSRQTSLRVPTSP